MKQHLELGLEVDVDVDGYKGPGKGWQSPTLSPYHVVPHAATLREPSSRGFDSAALIPVKSAGM